jgi:lysine 6-dehydrogenase
MPKIFILGAGRVGSAIARDLAQYAGVVAIDYDQKTLTRLSAIDDSISTVQTDLTAANFELLLAPADLVVSAVPGHLGFSTLKKIIEVRKNVVDISFFPEDPFELDQLARNIGVKAVVDCGVAPGMANIILGRYDQVMKIDRYECLVGGLPEKRDWPWQYKAVFSPIDVIEEYIRPARFVSGGKVVVREALSDPELVDFEETGTLESFNTDGLRTLIRTMKIPDMVERTLRYPGTIEYLRVLHAGGFFSYDPVEIDGRRIRPIDLTARLLFPQWKLEEGEKDITVMNISIKGTDPQGNNRTINYRLFDGYDELTHTLSMARTTGYTCTAVVSLMLDNRIDGTGIIPPEKIGENEANFKFILGYLRERGVIYKKKG